MAFGQSRLRAVRVDGESLAYTLYCGTSLDKACVVQVGYMLDSHSIQMKRDALMLRTVLRYLRERLFIAFSFLLRLLTSCRGRSVMLEARAR